MDIHTERIRQYLLDMVAINSVNPSLEEDGSGEGAMTSYIVDQIRDPRIELNIDQIEPGRFNVIARIPGTGGGRSLMLNAHMDTVGVAGMTDPFDPREEDGKVYGRGAYDMKGSIAACMGAFQAILNSSTTLSGDLLLTLSADEEYASIGTQDLVKKYTADAVIVTEPTELSICLAHKGMFWLQIDVQGRAAHGSLYDEGIDANMQMGHLLGALSSYANELLERKPHPLAGPPSMHASTLNGGSEWSMYAAQSTLQLERRLVPGENSDAVLQEYLQILDQVKREHPDFDAKASLQMVREPYAIEKDSPIVECLQTAAAKVTGSPPAVSGKGFWMDSALFGAAGIPAVIIGPAGGGAHAAVEWVDLESVYQLTDILVQTALDFCK